MKRRLRMLVLVLVLSAAFFRVPASAVAGSNSAATRADFTATVDIDGNCLVTMQLSLHLDKEEENLYFPLPGTAANITINGSSQHHPVQQLCDGESEQDHRRQSRRLYGPAVLYPS